MTAFDAGPAALVALGLLAVVSAVLVFVVDSMARSAYSLLLSFLAVAAMLLVLRLPYLALVTALMMTIEMAIMAVFMVMMMMNPAGLMPMTMVHNARGSAVVGAVTFLALAVGVWTTDWSTVRAGSGAGPDVAGTPRLPEDSTRQLGEAIMGSHMLVMLVIGVALLATIVAGTVLSTGRGRYDRFGSDLARRVPDDPVPGGLPR